MDHKLTAKIQAYLQQAPAERDVVEGARLLLSLNRNKILFQNIVRKPQRYADKVVYELKKHLKIRLDDKTLSDVVAMEKTVVPLAQETISSRLSLAAAEIPEAETHEELVVESKHVGRREDHDSLPEAIKGLWDECAGLWFKIKETFETLKTMEKAPACDRYEYLKILDEADKKYRANMAKYDAYASDGESEGGEHDELDPAKIAKKVQAARKYISDNKTKLAELREADDFPNSKYDTLLAKVQERYNFLIESGNSVSEEQVAELVNLGVVVQ